MLHKHGYTTSARWEEYLPTNDEWDAIYGAIESADNILVIVSPDTMDSPIVREELEYDARHNKRFIPVVRRDANTSAFNPDLQPSDFTPSPTQTEAPIFTPTSTATRTPTPTPQG